MAGGIIPFVMPPVHHSQIRRGELLPFVAGQLGQRGVGNQLTDIVHCPEDGRLIVRVKQVMENGSRDNRKAVFCKLRRNKRRVNRQIAVRPQLNGTVPRLTGFE